MKDRNLHENLVEFALPQHSSNRNFGITFSIVFALLGLLPLLGLNEPHYWLLVTAIFTLMITIYRVDWLALPNRLWSKFGLLLGKIVTPVILTVLFFGLLMPLGLILRCCGKDLLRLRLHSQCKSYWIKRDPAGPEPQTLRQQF